MPSISFTSMTYNRGKISHFINHYHSYQIKTKIKNIILIKYYLFPEKSEKHQINLFQEFLENMKRLQ